MLNCADFIYFREGVIAISDYIMDLRKIVGRRPILQVGAGVIVEDERGRILLQLRKDNKCWGYAGGSVELDEVVEDTARRELFEETGLVAKSLKPFGVFSGPQFHYIYPNGDEVSNVDIVYVCRKYEGELKAQESEVLELRFFEVDNLPENLSPPVADVIRKWAMGRLSNTEDVTNDREVIEFLLRAKKATYASDGERVASSRSCSQDLQYCEDEYKYYDTYLGTESFAGEEAVWRNNIPIWSMNYMGRVTGENFSIGFLKEALLNVPFDKPFRGPEYFEKDGYTYKMECVGDFSWFQGKEIVSYMGEEVYECYFHGGNIK